MARDAPKTCPACGTEIRDGRPDRKYCDDNCRLRGFRARQESIGRKRTRSGYDDNMTAFDARDLFGFTA